MKKSGSRTSRNTSTANRKNTSASQAKKSANSRKTSGRSGSAIQKASSKSASSTRSSSSKAGNTKPNVKANNQKGSSREGLTDVLKDLLKDIYYAEKQLVKALRKVSKASSHEQLREAFDRHREETEMQVELLGQAFEAMGMRAAGKKCPAMDGLIEETNEHIQEMEKGAALDAALIVGAQKIEHYEIATYGSMRTFANSLGLTECEEIFDRILQQESETDELLTQVAQAVNRDALDEDETSMEEEQEMSEMEA